MTKHPDFLPIHILEEFPEHQTLFQQVKNDAISQGDSEETPWLFTRRVCDFYLNNYRSSGNLPALAPFIAFVNRQYEEHPDFRVWLSSFIRALPDPRVDTELAELLSPRVRAKLDERWDWRQEPGWQQFVLRACHAFPQFQTYADTNTYGREKDVLAMTFLIDVTAHCVANVIDGSPERTKETQDFINYLETEYGKDDRLDYLISDSFIGNFPHRNKPGYDIVKLLTPKLEAVCRQRRNMQPDDQF